MRRLALLFLLVGPLFAQDEQKLLRQQFEAFDQDGNGSLERKEFPGSDRQFAQMDKDRNGSVGADEFVTSEVAQRFLRASYRNKVEPRPRATAESLALQRLAVLSRFDPNRDGKVTRAEWTGSEAAFATLDLDGSGVIDQKDLSEARAAAPPPKPPLPELRGEYLDPDAILKRLDKDGDGKVSGREFDRMKELLLALPHVDRDKDQALDRDELQRLLYLIGERLQQEERDRGRPQPYPVPFDEWDKDKSGRVEQNEWQGNRALFELIDQNRDAAVSREEVDRYKKMVTGDDFVGRFDLNGDGRVTLDEFGGPPAAFQRADRNGDGAVTRADLR